MRGDALALITHDAEVHEHAHRARVTADVDAMEREQLFEVHIGEKSAGAHDLEAIVEEPDLRRAPLGVVVAVRGGIDDRLLPREFGVLGNGPEAMAHETRWLADDAVDCLEALLDGRWKIALEARALLHVVLGAELAFRADDTKETKPCIRVFGP